MTIKSRILLLVGCFALMASAVTGLGLVTIQDYNRILREVSEGESFTVMSRGRAVARVLPVDRDREQRSIQYLLNFVSGLPIRHAGNWLRDDLYE